MHRYLLNTATLVLILFYFVSCGNDSALDTGDPSNLEVEIEILQDGMGNVEVVASADNVVSFEFDPGDGSDVEENTSGLFSYKYQFSGNYSIIIKAYGASGRFLQKEILATISIQDEDITQYEGYELVWQDEFNSSTLNLLDWNFETGAGGWGNNELQNYKKENVSVTGGHLIITAREESPGMFTSSRITTQDKFEFEYGRVDIRAKLPEGQGIWPALWMLGSNFNTVGWPACGEIDIMEMIGGSGRENTIHGTLHWQDPNGNPGNNNHAEFGKSFTGANSFSDDFHVFSIIWDEAKIEWLVDGNSFQVQSILDPNKSEFQDFFFFIVNVAVGGNWPGNPDSTTEFPQQLMVDYIRVYQEN